VSVFDAVIGQPVVADVRAAVADARDVRAGRPGAGSVMTHAWLLTGPPGSGRSVLARAFAAALQCHADDAGCGRCADCRAVLAGQHPDVLAVATQGLSISIDRVRRELVPVAARRPTRGHWQVVLVEDADRLTEDAADALLLALEEPPERTVWLLCAPTSEDVVPTIRSRCRAVGLRTPPPADITAALIAEGTPPAEAAYAARASMGHIGRARALAQDPEVRRRRRDALRLPFSLGTPAECLAAAQELIAAAEQDAEQACDALDAAEVEQLRRALGIAAGTRRDRSAEARLKELEREQRTRRTRVRRDSLDRALLDLLALYADVLQVQLGTGRPLVNDDLADAVAREARSSSAESTVRRMAAVTAAREALQANAAAPLTLEALALTLKVG
jgi:DNA polymerase-3 subunit delta'